MNIATMLVLTGIGLIVLANGTCKGIPPRIERKLIAAGAVLMLVGFTLS